jgi:hypothetical protein
VPVSDFEIAGYRNTLGALDRTLGKGEVVSSILTGSTRKTVIEFSAYRPLHQSWLFPDHSRPTRDGSKAVKLTQLHAIPLRRHYQ